MPTTFDKILGKPLLHTHQASDITGLPGNDVVATVSNNQILVPSSANVLLVNAVSGPISITLPAATAVLGMTFKIKKIDISSNIVTIVPNVGDNIEGVAENLVVEFQNTAVQLMSTNSGWFII